MHSAAYGWTNLASLSDRIGYVIKMMRVLLKNNSKMMQGEQFRDLNQNLDA